MEADGHKNKTLKILCYVHRYGVPARRFIRNGIQDLRREGHEVLVVTDVLVEPAVVDAAKVIVVPHRAQMPLSLRLRRKWKKYVRGDDHPLDRRIAFNLSLPLASTRAVFQAIVRDFQPHVIHVHFGFSLPYVMHLLDNRPPCPVLVTFRGVDASAFLNGRAYRHALKKALRHPAVHSSSVADALRKNLAEHGVDTPRHRLLYTSIDTELYQRRSPGSPRAVRQFLQISTLEARKGIAITLRAFARWHAKNPGLNWRLTLAGDGPEETSLRALARELGLSAHLDWTGRVSVAEGRALLETAHVFVHHSITPADGDMEGIPNTVLEAMSMELPVIVSDHSGLPEALDHGSYGYLVPEKDIDQLAEAIERAYRLPYQPAARARVLRQFSRDKHLIQLLAIYRALVETAAKAPASNN